MTEPAGGHRLRGGQWWAAFIMCLITLAGGTWLVYTAAFGQDAGPHAQPLPAHLFSLSPNTARNMPRPATLDKPQPGSAQTECTPLPAGRSQVAIRSLCIYAPIIATRVEGDSLIIPADVHQVGLDTDSAPLAATMGTSVIAGHVDNVHQGDGVFYFLHQVQPGAEIMITGLDHKVTTWRVYKTDVVAKHKLPRDIWSTGGVRRLVLVTCGGPLLRMSTGNTYEDNVLVYATPASE